MRPMYLLMAVLCGTVLAVVGARADCADYRILDTLGTCPLPAAGHRLAARGDHYLVAAAEAGLQVVALAGDGAPHVVAALALPGSARDVAVTGSVAVVALATGGLQVVDVSQPGSPLLVGAIPASYGPSVEALGGGLFLGYAADGLSVFDVTDPAQPVVVGSLPESELVPGGDLAVAGAFAYTGGAIAGAPADEAYLLQIDLANPAGPTIVRSLAVRPFGAITATTEAHVYVAAESVNELDPALTTRSLDAYDFGGATPVALGTLPVSDPLTALACADGRLVAVGGQLVTVDPLSLAVLGTRSGFADALGLAVAPNRIVVAGAAGLTVVDGVRAVSPAVVGETTIGGTPTDLAVVGDVALVTTGKPSLLLFDVADPGQPSARGELALAGAAVAVAVRGATAIVAVGGAGVQMIDVGDGSAPQVVGGLALPGNANDVAVQGDLAFVADESAGLVIVDIADPAEPAIVGQFDPPAIVDHVTVQGTRACVSKAYGGVLVLDVSAPAAPTLLATVPGLDDEITAIGSADGRLWVCGASQDLDVVRAYDLADPSQPASLGAVALSGIARGLAFAAGQAYVATSTGRVTIVGVGDGLAPRELATKTLGGPLAAAAIAGDCLYVAGAGRFAALPLQCGTATPTYLRQFEAAAGADEAVLRWRVLADAEPTRFRLWRRLDDAGREVPYAADGLPGAYVARDRWEGAPAGATITYELHRLDASGAQYLLDSRALMVPVTATRRARVVVAPNPFNPVTTLTCELPSPGPVRLTVYDPAGRLVRTLLAGPLAAGTHAIAWDGRDAAGCVMASGSYLARLEHGGQVAVARMVLVR